MIVTWRSGLAMVLHVFNVRSLAIGSDRQSLTTPFQTELEINTHMMVADIHRNAMAGQEDTVARHYSASTTLRPQITVC